MSKPDRYLGALGVVDLDGQKRLFNLHCNGGVFNLGHRNQELIDLLKSSLNECGISAIII